MSTGGIADLAWDRLRREVSGDSDLGMPSFALRTSTPLGPARLAIGSGGEARLLLPLAAGASFPDIGDSPGLVLRDTVLLSRGLPIRFIDMMCRDNALEDVFRDVVSAILKRTDGGAGVAEAIEGAVGEYRALLKRRTQPAATAEIVLGLLGELFVLSKLLDRSPGAGASWMGPSGARHDFRRGDAAIEVKTAVRRQTRTIEISAIDQLAEPVARGILMLACVFVEADPAGALSVPDLVREILQKTSDSDHIRSMLSAAGYDHEVPETFDPFRFSLQAFELYEVKEGFPRLTPADLTRPALPPGVSHFRYRVDLSTARNFQVADADTDRRLEEFLQP